MNQGHLSFARTLSKVLSVTLISLYACAQGEDPSQAKGEKAERGLAATTSSTLTQGPRASDASQLPSDTGSSWQALPRLSSADIFAVETSPVTVYAEANDKQKLCELALDTELLIVDRPEGFLKVRLDRVTQLQSGCPAASPFGYIMGTMAEPDPAGSNIDAVGTRRYMPRTLMYDLKVYANPSKQEPPLCVLAKGVGVLVASDSEPSLQMPKSSQCEESKATAYFNYQPGLWWEDQPQ